MEEVSKSIAIFLSRNFLLPLLCAVMWSSLVYLDKLPSLEDKGASGAILLAFAGLFSIGDAFKAYLAAKRGSDA